MKRTTLGMLGALLVCGAAAVAHGDDIEVGRKTSFTTSFKVQVKATATEQWAYALSLTKNLAALPPGQRRITAALQATAALELIPKNWPAEKHLSSRAWITAAQVLFNNQLYPSAVDLCEKAERALGRGDSARLAALRGASLTRLGRYDEAASAFAAATRPEAVAALNDADKLDVLNRAAEVHERSGNCKEAVRLLRAASRCSPSAVHRAGILLRSIDANEKAGDRQEARNDLASLEQRSIRRAAAS